MQRVHDQWWAYDRRWLRGELDRTRTAIARIEARSQTCIIAGNGPSLLATDATALDGHDVFITNYAFLNEPLLDRARFQAVVNPLVAQQDAAGIVAAARKVTTFVPFWLAQWIAPNESIFLLNATGDTSFSTDARQRISAQSTVSYFCMQLAYAFGYRKCVLVGFDHRYEQAKELREGDLIEQTGDDRNHFDAGYFKHKTWQAADVDKMAAVYRRARDAFELDGRAIVNCTIGGALEVFPRGSLEAELRTAPTEPRRPNVEARPASALHARVRDLVLFSSTRSGLKVIAAIGLLGLLELGALSRDWGLPITTLFVALRYGLIIGIAAIWLQAQAGKSLEREELTQRLRLDIEAQRERLARLDR